MILKETILSAFTERGTLLKWLKKVEAALNANILTDISLEQIDETHVKIKFTFENGEFVESPVLTLPRGEKGEQGEEGTAATVKVGTVTTGAAGTNASVMNVGDDHHAILNFVIPRGDTGAPGEGGSAGAGFDDVDEISINDGAINITADANGINIEASFEVAVGEEILEIPSSMYLPVKGSESIVIDVDESGDFIEIHLDADIAAKLGRVLVTPMSAPASVSLVAVDTSNAQAMLTIGEGLSVSDGVLSASGGASSVEYVDISIEYGGNFVSKRLILGQSKQLSNLIKGIGFINFTATSSIPSLVCLTANATAGKWNIYYSVLTTFNDLSLSEGQKVYQCKINNQVVADFSANLSVESGDTISITCEQYSSN